VVEWAGSCPLLPNEFNLLSKRRNQFKCSTPSTDKWNSLKTARSLSHNFRQGINAIFIRTWKIISTFYLIADCITLSFFKSDNNYIDKKFSLNISMSCLTKEITSLKGLHYFAYSISNPVSNLRF